MSKDRANRYCNSCKSWHNPQLRHNEKSSTSAVGINDLLMFLSRVMRMKA